MREIIQEDIEQNQFQQNADMFQHLEIIKQSPTQNVLTILSLNWTNILKIDQT